MTKVVRGAGRKKAAARKKHNEQEKRVVGGKRDDAIKRAAKGEPAPSSTADDWDTGATLGANVDRLKTAGVTWKRIGELANANGHDVPWPDGGRLLRARKQFLKGTEGQPTQRRSRKPKAAAGAADAPEMTVEERVANALHGRQVPWMDGIDPDDHTKVDYTDEELLAMLVGRAITYVSRNSGKTYTSRVPKDSRHNKIKHGKDGPYVDFASMEGPFEAISLSRIVEVS